MNRIPILYIIDTFTELGGAEKNLFDIVTKINKEKFTPYVYTLKSTQPMIDNLNKLGIYAKDINLKRIYGIKAIIEAIKLIKFIKKEKIKIVVTYHEGSDFWGGITARLAKVPVVISSRRDMGYKLNKRHIFLYRLINNRIFDKIITVSEAVKDIIFERENTLLYKMQTIYNGVELEKYSKEYDKKTIKKSLGIEENASVVGMIASIRPIKGYEYFIEAASIVLKDFPNTYFLIVGNYNEKNNYYKKIKFLTKKLGIEKNIIFTKERKDIPELLSILDISVLSSINEGFSNTIIESMAAGKPVIATNAGGNPEAIIDGITGILVEPKNSLELAEGIKKLLKDKELAKKMGDAGKERVKKYFSSELMLRTLENLYYKILFEKER